MADTTKIVNKGLGLITGLLAASVVKYVHWGTGTTAAGVTQTALVTPAAEGRTSGTQSSIETTTSSGIFDIYQCVGAIVCVSAAKAITEVGIFDASSSGNMYFRGTHDAINVSVGDSIQYTIKTTFVSG